MNLRISSTQLVACEDESIELMNVRETSYYNLPQSFISEILGSLLNKRETHFHNDNRIRVFRRLKLG